MFGAIEATNDPALILMSATSIAPYSNYYDIRIKPNWFLRNVAQQKPEIKIETHLFSDHDNWIKTSGYGNNEERLQAVTRLVEKMIKTGYLQQLSKENRDQHLLDQAEVVKNIRLYRGDREQREIWERKQNESPRVVSLVCSSFEMNELVGRKLVEEFGEDQVAVLYTPGKKYNGTIIQQQPYHATKNQMKKLHLRGIKYFVFVHSSIGRGYNILRGPTSDESLINQQIWMMRPYPTPDHFDDMVMFLHGRLP
jgi:hypothetical protein